MGSAPASLADNPFLITLLLEMQTTIFLRTEMSRKTEYVHNPCFLSANILKILGVFAENQIIFYPKMKKDIFYALKNDNFTYPICLDLENTFYDTNKIPGDMMLQTFLLDEDNKIVAIGNPIHNSKIKDLFLNIISGGQFHPDEKCPQTEVKIDALSMDLGMFDWKKEQKCIFTIQNTGKNLLVIDDINTSCGCTTVEYSKEPVQSGKSIDIAVTYKAEHPEHFNKTITVYCNSESSPLQLKIKGDAK
ncbi:DUF1573 domain-containing protein [Bacteroides fragilis]|nr:DUF1573 domain-containing protein [Bacteroides fragilis]